MTKRALSLAAAVLLLVAGTCKKAASDDEAIRAAIQQHLQKNSGLNLAAMDTEFQNISVDGDHARAQVLFRTKQEGATMQMTYALERQGGQWTVLKSNPSGGQVSHPPVDGSHAAPGGGGAPGDAGGGELPRFHTPSDSAPKPSKPTN